MVGNHALTAKGPGFIPGWGTKIPQAMRQKKKKKKENLLTKKDIIWNL